MKHITHIYRGSAIFDSGKEEETFAWSCTCGAGTKGKGNTLIENTRYAARRHLDEVLPEYIAFVFEKRSLLAQKWHGMINETV